MNLTSHYYFCDISHLKVTQKVSARRKALAGVK